MKIKNGQLILKDYLLNIFAIFNTILSFFLCLFAFATERYYLFVVYITVGIILTLVLTYCRAKNKITTEEEIKYENR